MFSVNVSNYQKELILKLILAFKLHLFKKKILLNIALFNQSISQDKDDFRRFNIRFQKTAFPRGPHQQAPVFLTKREYYNHFITKLKVKC